jgi:Domain of unknown function (DUF6597)
MCKLLEPGVLYTEYERIKANTLVASLWSYETFPRGGDRPSVLLTRDGNREYWLERSDPLLNTILPGTGVSLIVNFGDLWASGRSLVTSAHLPRACVIGPVTRMQTLRVGRSVRAVGVGLQSALTHSAFGVQASELVDQLVPLDDLWTRNEVERLYAELSHLDTRRCVRRLRDELITRIGREGSRDVIASTAARVIQRVGGRVSVDAMARSHGLSRQQFGRRFHATCGLPQRSLRGWRGSRLLSMRCSPRTSRHGRRSRRQSASTIRHT